MTIANLNDVAAGLAGGDRQRFIINKATTSSLVVGRYGNLWRATGVPGQGAIPTTTAICSKADTGAWAFVSPDTANSKALYFAGGGLICSNTLVGIEIHDRLVHMGGLNGTTLTAQTTSLVVSGTSSNLQQRLGATDLSELQWWLEWYTVTGATAVNATCAVTYTDTSTGNIVVAVTSNTNASNAYLLAPASGKIIKSVDNVTLSASTGTAGNFGVTVTRRLFMFDTPNANVPRKLAWHETDLALCYENACINILTMPTAVTSGTLIGSLNVIHK
jgi:hypothetical protein